MSIQDRSSAALIAQLRKNVGHDLTKAQVNPEFLGLDYHLNASNDITERLQALQIAALLHLNTMLTSATGQMSLCFEIARQMQFFPPEMIGDAKKWQDYSRSNLAMQGEAASFIREDVRLNHALLQPLVHAIEGGTIDAETAEFYSGQTARFLDVAARGEKHLQKDKDLRAKGELGQHWFAAHEAPSYRGNDAHAALARPAYRAFKNVTVNIDATMGFAQSLMARADYIQRKAMNAFPERTDELKLELAQCWRNAIKATDRLSLLGRISHDYHVMAQDVAP